MFDFTDEQKMVRTMMRKWVEAHLAPAVDALEDETVLPYDLMRSFIKTFGVDEMARAAMKKSNGAPPRGKRTPPTPGVGTTRAG